MLSSIPSRSARAETGSGERRSLRERGAAALEFALIAPLFFLVVFGGIELGYMFRSNLAIEDTARVAARVAAVQRNGPFADQIIMQQIQDRAGDLNGEIERVVIFAAPSLDYEMPDLCKTAAGHQPGQNCNVYEVNLGAGDTLQDVIDDFDELEVKGIDATTDRRPGDNIGVYIQYEYSYVTGFLSSITLDSSSIQVVELDL